MSGEYVTIGTKHWTVKPERRAARAKAATKSMKEELNFDEFLA